ncbi:MAG TPA: tagatose 1,6-diphosphate aldolase [Methylomirabilota bacterium]|nr:tagatose 1,6-diphosphate aldolase [Methylomirabilota bacterium]
MALLLGTRRGLDATSSPRGTFAVLALDHRQNLRKELHSEDPTATTTDEMIEFKRTVVRSLASIATGTLLDPEIGAAQCIADGSLPGGAGLIVALEATGYEGEAGARVSRLLPGWDVARAKRLGASAAKLLVYYHPEAPNAADQERLVAGLADDCRAQDLALFVEPLSFGLDGGALTGEDRRRVVIETARRMTALGGDVLKAEFPYDASVDDPARWTDACAELDAASRLPWVLLSGGVDDATFEAQVGVACGAGASGVLVGRSVWAPAAALASADRATWLETEGAARLRRLAELVERAGHPWRERWVAATQPEAPEPGWYTRY